MANLVGGCREQTPKQDTPASATPAAASVTKAASAGTSQPKPSPQELAAARIEARRWYAAATLEPNDEKAQELFERVAEVLPPGGVALYRAGHAAKRGGNSTRARQLFARALAALERATGQVPEIRAESWQSGAESLAVGALGRLVLAQTYTGAMVFDAIGWWRRFDFEGRTKAAALSADGTLVIVATEQQLLVCSLVEATCTARELKVAALALTEDGNTLAACTRGGEAHLFETATLRSSGTVPPKNGKATAVLFSPDAAVLFVGRDNGSVDRVNVTTMKIEGHRGGHQRAVVALARDHAGRFLVSADRAGVRIGGATAAQSEFLTEVHDSGQAIELVVGPRDQRLFVQQSGHVSVWSLTDRQLLDESIGLPAVGDLRFAVAPQRFVAASEAYHQVPWAYSEYWLQTFDLADTTADHDSLEPLPGETSWGQAVVPEFDLLVAGDTVAVGDNRCQVNFWDLARGTYLGQSRKLRLERYCVLSISPDGKWVARDSTDHAGELQTLDVHTKVVSTQPGDRSTLKPRVEGAPDQAVEAVRQGDTLAWASEDGTVRVGRAGSEPHVLATRQDRRGEPPHGDELYANPRPPLVLSPTGQRLAYRTSVDETRLWDTSTGALQLTVRSPGVSGMAFGKTGVLFIGALDGTLTTVEGDLAKRQIVPGGTPLFALAPARQGRVIVGAGQGAVFLWSGLDGRWVATLRGPVAQLATGVTEVFGSDLSHLGCNFGPFRFPLELCRDKLVESGALRRALEELR